MSFYLSDNQHFVAICVVMILGVVPYVMASDIT